MVLTTGADNHLTEQSECAIAINIPELLPDDNSVCDECKGLIDRSLGSEDYIPENSIMAYRHCVICGLINYRPPQIMIRKAISRDKHHRRYLNWYLSNKRKISDNQ